MKSIFNCSRKSEQILWTKTTTFVAGIFLNSLLLMINWMTALNIRLRDYYIDELTLEVIPTGVTMFRMPNLLTFIVLLGLTAGLNILMIIVLMKDKERRYAIVLGSLVLLAVLLPLIGGLFLQPALVLN